MRPPAWARLRGHFLTRVERYVTLPLKSGSGSRADLVKLQAV